MTTQWKPVEDTARAISCIVITVGFLAVLITQGGWGWLALILIILVFGMAS